MIDDREFKEMTEKYKKILALTLLILFVLYWLAVNFLVSAVLSPLAVPALYLLARPITAIGGRSWKE